MASQQRNGEAVVYLLEEGSNARTIDKRGNTALHYAVGTVGSDVESIKKLIEHYPLAPLISNAVMKTPLHLIVESWRDDAAQALQIMLRALPLSRLANHPVTLSPKTTRGHTPLHVAVLEKDVELAKLLIAAGSKVDTRDQLGRTPLEAAVRDSDPEMVALLLNAGASPRKILEKNNIIDNANIREMLLFYTRNPMPLVTICRRVISLNFGPTIQDYLDHFPKAIRDFIMYE